MSNIPKIVHLSCGKFPQDGQNKGQPYGDRARQATSDLTLAKTVTVEAPGQDKYQHTLGDAFLSDATHVNRGLVAEGWNTPVTQRSGQFSKPCELLPHRATGKAVQLAESVRQLFRNGEIDIKFRTASLSPVFHREATTEGVLSKISMISLLR